MKRVSLLAMYIMALFSFASCQSIEHEDPSSELIHFTAYRTADDSTKALLDGKVVKWEVGDQVDVSDGVNVETVTLSAEDISEDGLTADISTLTLSSTASVFYAAFPHCNVQTISSAGVTFKDDVLYDCSNSFEAVSMTSSRDFSFLNVKHVFALSTAIDGASYVEIVGNNAETADNGVVFSTEDASIVSSSSSSDFSVKCILDEGVAYLPVLPGITFAKGFTIRVCDDDDIVLTSFEYGNSFSSRRNVLTRVKDFDSRTNLAYIDKSGVYHGQGITIDGIVWAPVYNGVVAWRTFNNGTEAVPVKSGSDPCPDGWRVPTYSEVNTLASGGVSDWVTVDGVRGRWFTGSKEYSDSVQPRLFLAETTSTVTKKDAYGQYTTTYPVGGRIWTSKLSSQSDQNFYYVGIAMNFTSETPTMTSYNSQASSNTAYTVYKHQVRCVKE